MGSVRVAPLPASVGAVRSMLRDDLTVLPEPVREDVALVVSELLGNAMRHARSLADGRLAVEWAFRDGAVEVGVTDGGGPTAPMVIEPAPTDIGGRGLSIVASVASRWGVEQHGQERTVWAIVPMRSQPLLHA